MATISVQMKRPERIQWTLVVGAFFALFSSHAGALETVNIALSNKNFQMILYPIAQERGYMQEEGIDLRVIRARAELSAGNVALQHPLLPLDLWVRNRNRQQQRFGIGMQRLRKQ